MYALKPGKKFKKPVIAWIHLVFWVLYANQSFVSANIFISTDESCCSPCHLITHCFWLTVVYTIYVHWITLINLLKAIGHDTMINSWQHQSTHDHCFQDPKYGGEETHGKSNEKPEIREHHVYISGGKIKDVHSISLLQLRLNSCWL